MIRIYIGLIYLIYLAVVIAILGGLVWIALAIWKSLISIVLSL